MPYLQKTQLLQHDQIVEDPSLVQVSSRWFGTSYALCTSSLVMGAMSSIL
ncbi:2652_t:CDS:2 [Ambispora gerdemannii]|uniref:2652_t:CDS:1 n=1 Tax=Ambispora gerdemannii TaxID=144530 RepID=A0A9N9AGI1_9GLOM|nr:2652_t:CDS:2 [Ambispora gerdemannii]